MNTTFVPVAGACHQGIEALKDVPHGVAYSDCVRVDLSDHTLLFLSGKTASKNGALTGRTMLEQARQVIENTRASIERQGGSLRDVVRLRIFVTQLDANSIRDVHAARREYFEPDRFPASTLVEVAGFVRAGGLIEMEADVVLPRSDCQVAFSPALASPDRSIEFASSVRPGA